MIAQTLRGEAVPEAGIATALGSTYCDTCSGDPYYAPKVRRWQEDVVRDSRLCNACMAASGLATPPPGVAAAAPAPPLMALPAPPSPEVQELQRKVATL